MNPYEILIIDDDPDARDVLTAILVQRGYRVSSVSSVAEAIVTAEKNPPHLILCDLNMPGEGGLAFLARRHALPSLAKAKAIVISAFSDADSVYEALALGVSNYVTKPIQERTLLPKIRQALNETSFRRFQFQEGQTPQIRAWVAAEGRVMSAAELTIQCATKLGPESKLVLSGELPKNIGIEGKTLSSASEPPMVAALTRQYLCRIALAGLTQETINRLQGKKGRAA